MIRKNLGQNVNNSLKKLSFNGLAQVPYTAQGSKIDCRAFLRRVFRFMAADKKLERAGLIILLSLE